MRHLGFVLSALLAVAFSLAACKHSSGASNPPDFTGTYKLVSINGHALPFTPPHEGGAPEVRSGLITLNADGTHLSSIGFALPNGQVASRDVGGTWEHAGKNLTMKWTGAGITTATLDGDVLTMDNEGMTFVYRK